MNEPGHMLTCLRLIHAAHDADGCDLSAWPAEAAAEIERLADALMERERDARRYRWLRAQHWNDNTIAAVRWPKDAMRLGHDAPSGERLDAAIDEAILKTPNA